MKLTTRELFVIRVALGYLAGNVDDVNETHWENETHIKVGEITGHPIDWHEVDALIERVEDAEPGR